MNRRNATDRISLLAPRPRGWTLGALMAAALAVAACDRDAPLHPADGRALPPTEASRQVNPLCTGTGTTHHYETISTAVTWAASGNPHKVTGTVSINTGGQLTLQPGVIVCFSPQQLLQVNRGRLVAQGLPATRIVLTATDPALGWFGVSLQNEPSSASVIKHVTIEFASRSSVGVSSFMHPVSIDSTIIRQSGRGVDLWGRGASFSRSRVDTTTNRDYNIAAVVLHDSTRFEQSVILRAANIGLRIEGSGVNIVGGRIEGSGGVGISATQFSGIPWATPLRVVGGNSYPIESSVQMLRALYTTSTSQDSLKGNARDTVLMRGGELRQTLLVRPGLPWHVTGSITALVNGALRGEGGSLLVMDPGVGISAHSGGRVLMRGTRTNPVVLTADDPSLGWAGITLEGTPISSSSYITNTRVEHVAYGDTALAAYGTHPVIVDSAVFRRTGRAVSLFSTGSRLSRSRVDTTLASTGPAVELGGDAILESTLIRGSSKHGLLIRSSAVQVLSCEVRESAMHGIVTDGAAPVHNCNLVGNTGVGVNNPDPGVTVNATGNWWGDVGGPTAPSGDGVAGVVTYTPWLTAPVVLPYVP
jgi:hypothetical protein